LLRKALAEAAHRTGEEIEYGIAGAHSAESKAAVLQIADQNIVLRVDRIEPETDMVRAMDPIDIVGKLICIDIQMSGRASSASNTKTAICHTEAKIVRNQRGDVDTQRLRIKELGVGPTKIRPARKRQMKRIHQCGRKRVSIADSGRLRALLVSRAGRN